MRLLESKNGKAWIGCWFVFAVLELWVYLSAFGSPSASSSHLLWEAPVSLVLFVLGYGFCLRYLLSDLLSKGLAALWVLSSLACALLAFIPITPPTPSPWQIKVYKSERWLEVYRDQQKLADYRIALGKPEGDKEVMSDGKTPEGNLLVCDKGPSMFHKWLGLNYPTADDAWRGRKAAKITWGELWYIRVENLNGRIPYGNSALGGAIGIHGGGAGPDWTLGCVGLANNDIDQFYDNIPLGTEVLIYP